jgi:site-specific DNA-methyltransferase (adenine-specific)
MLKEYNTSTFSYFTLYHRDSTDIMSQLNNQFDMIFADPPYFLSTGNGRVNIKGKYIKFNKGEWDKVRSSDEKDRFNMSWLTACKDCLKDNGTIWVSGTYHNIFSVADCMEALGYNILNFIVWHKPDSPNSLTEKRFDFSAEYIIGASKSKSANHYFNKKLMSLMNNGEPMQDVWTISVAERWEKMWGKHPTQKPLQLLYRIIMSSTPAGASILAPFAGSCTTGIAANLIGRTYVSIDQSSEFLDLGVKRRQGIADVNTATDIYSKMAANPNEPMVLVNHARPDLYNKMIVTGIYCLRAGDSKGSLLVKPRFERIQYVLLHNGGANGKLFTLKTKRRFKLWTKDSLEKYGFKPTHAPYYVVLQFYNQGQIVMNRVSNLYEDKYTYIVKIRPINEFLNHVFIRTKNKNAFRLSSDMSNRHSFHVVIFNVQ